MEFPEKAERVLIGLLLLAILMIAQRYHIWFYRVGLLLLVAGTLVQIGVGNLPKDATPGQSARFVGVVLVIVAALFGIGILLVPYLSQLGR